MYNRSSILNECIGVSQEHIEEQYFAHHEVSFAWHKKTMETIKRWKFML